MEPLDSQREVCARYGVTPVPPAQRTTVGLALESQRDGVVVMGVRHYPVENTNGWYIWWGEERSDADDWFKPMHTEHLPDWCPEALPYLALPPGWGFIVAPGYEDVWFDRDFLVR